MPFERTLGADVGQLLAERYRSYGVDLRLATGVVGFRAGADGGVRAARLTDGTEVPCDLALVGIGDRAGPRAPAPSPRRLPDLSLRRRHRQRRPLDERRRPGDGRRAPHPRPPDRAAQARLLLVGPVRPAAPARRNDLPGRQRLLRRHTRFLRRAATTTAKDGSSEPSQPIAPPPSPRSDESSSSLQIAALSRPRAVQPFNARRALRMTATSIPSWSSAPATGGR